MRATSNPPELIHQGDDTGAINIKYVTEAIDIMSNGDALSRDRDVNIDKIDQLQELLGIDLASYGFPDCGNLRSTKKKDVKMRLICFQALLKEHIRSIEFREYVKTRMQSTEGARV